MWDEIPDSCQSQKIVGERPMGLKLIFMFQDFYYESHSFISKVAGSWDDVKYFSRL